MLLIVAQSGAIGTITQGQVQGQSRPYDVEFGILGSNRFVDIGCRDPTGFCSDRVSRLRLGTYSCTFFFFFFFFFFFK